jgi:hypothetical protein
MVTQPADAPRRFAVCAIFKNETRYLREWIEFHRLVGVAKFFLYDNSDDGVHADWHEVLDPYVDAGVVQVTHWPGPSAQLSAYHHALTSWGRTVRWMAFLDIDEFLFSPDEYLVPEVLHGYPGVGAVGVCWAVYGTSGVKVQRGLVTETYQWRSIDVGLSRHVKSIVRTARAVDVMPRDPHHFAVDGQSVDTLSRPLAGPFAVSPTYQHLRINHYVSKSEADATAKMLIPRADNGQFRDMNLLDESLNERHDGAIMRWLPELKKRLAANA